MEAPLFLKEGVTFVRDALSLGQERTAGLTVLAVRLAFKAVDPMVSLTLSAGGSGGKRGSAGNADPREPMSWEIPFAAFLDGGGPNLTLPSSLSEEVRRRLGGAETGPTSQPLWLKLARPYGMLGTAPWERELGSILARPVLRLPDFPERPAERPDVLQNAVIVDPAPDASASAIVSQVQTLAESILEVSSRTTTRIDIFTSARWYEVLAPLGANPKVTVHNPEDAQTSAAVLEADSRDAKPILRAAAWSNWIASKMGGRGIDAVHLFCRAYRTECGVELVLSSSPSPHEVTIAQLAVAQDELCLLLNRAGAWAVTLTPVAPDQHQFVAFFADSFAHSRPGAAVFYTQADVENGAMLVACKLLFASKVSDAPMLNDGFLYCHPGFVRGSAVTGRGEVASVLAENAALVIQRAPLLERIANTFTGAEPSVPPNWVGSTQRFLESAVFEDVRRSAPDVLFTNESPNELNAPISLSSSTTSTLSEIQNVVARYLKTHQGSE